MRLHLRQRSTFPFIWLTVLGFILFFFAMRIHVVYFGNGSGHFALSEILAGFLDDIFTAAGLGILAQLALQWGRAAYGGILFPVELITVIVAYANLQYINFFGDRLRLFDFEYIRNIGSTWKNTLFHHLWIRPIEILFLAVPLTAVFAGLILAIKTKPRRLSPTNFFLSISALAGISLFSLSGATALKNKADLNSYHQSNFCSALVRDIPRLKRLLQTTRAIKSTKENSPGQEDVHGTSGPRSLPDNYIRYADSYPFIKIPKKDAQRMGILPKEIKTVESDPAPRSGPYRNIVFIILESFRCKEIGFFGGSYSLTPYFDSLAAKGTVFRNFYGHHDMTAGAEFSVLNSFYDVFHGVAAMRAHDRINLFSLPEILEIFGYSNYWIHSWPAEFDNSRMYFKRHGRFSIIDKALFPPTAEQAGWSFSDEELMTLAAETLDKAAKPFFALILTATNHIPYEVPEKKFELGLEDGVFGKYLNTFHYTDYALGRFFDLIRRKEYFKNTLFFIFADTGNSRAKTNNEADFADYIDNEFHIPLLIYDPSQEQGRLIDELAGQIDIAPTALDLLGLDIADPFMGQSLLRKRNPPFYLAYHGRDVPWVNAVDDSFFYRLNVETNSLAAFDKKQKTRKLIGPDERRRIAADMMDKLSMVDWAILNDKIWDPRIGDFYKNLRQKN